MIVRTIIKNPILCLSSFTKPNILCFFDCTHILKVLLVADRHLSGVTKQVTRALPQARSSDTAETILPPPNFFLPSGLQKLTGIEGRVEQEVGTCH